MISLKFLTVFLYALLISQNYAAGISDSSLDYQKYIKFHWKGDVTSHSLTMKIFPNNEELQKEEYNSFLVLYTKSSSQAFHIIKTVRIEFPQETYSVAQLDIKDLTPNTDYHYSFVFTKAEELDAKTVGKLIQEDKKRSDFTFKTFSPELTPASFTFGAASCARSGSNSPVFNSLTDEKFNFFLQNGDLHYDDVAVDNVTKFYEAYYKVFSSPNQRRFYESTPIYYVWDDHDFGPNDADGNSPSKPAATSAYNKFVPHSPLKNVGLTQTNEISKLEEILNETPFGIFRSFVVGRCMFIVLDLRSFLEVKPGEILGENQEKWLEHQIHIAGATKEIKQVFIVESIPWIFNGGLTFEENVWSNYIPTKQKIAKLIEENLYKNNKKVMMIGGDAHMLGFDDGRNNAFGGFPVVQAASLDQKPNCKGGPYSHGGKPGRGQYGVIEVVDNGGETVCVKIDLKSEGESVIKYDTCHPELYPSTKSFKCHPSWTDFTLILVSSLVGIIVLGGLIVYIWRKAKQPKNVVRNRINIKYSGLEEEEDGRSFEMKENQSFEELDQSIEIKIGSNISKRKGSSGSKSSAMKGD